MWRAMFDLHGLTAAEPGELERFVEKAMLQCATTLDFCLRHVPATQWVLVEQSRLRSAPEATIRAVVDALRIAASVDAVTLSTAIERTASGVGTGHALPLPPTAAAAAGALSQAQQRALSVQRSAALHA
jgi:hypothetical protein